jgi:hypothetical protein
MSTISDNHKSGEKASKISVLHKKSIGVCMPAGELAKSRGNDIFFA